MAEPYRDQRRALAALVRQVEGGQAMTVGQVARALNVGEERARRALRALYAAGEVSRRRDFASAYVYTLTDKGRSRAQGRVT